MGSLISTTRTDHGGELRAVHLVAGVPMADAEEVYLAAAAALGDWAGTRQAARLLV